MFFFSFISRSIYSRENRFCKSNRNKEPNRIVLIYDRTTTSLFPSEIINIMNIECQYLLPDFFRPVHRRHAGAKIACRYSDSSQYDNVPTRMRGSSPGILKRQRDVSFADPRRSRGYRPQETAEDHPGRQQQQRRQRPDTRDEIEMLEECFDELRTSTTTTATTSAATQTIGADRKTSTATIIVGAPVTPNDPGYVRHMSSNWPQNLKPKTP